MTLDLYHASRDDLIRHMLEQRETIIDLERQVATLAAAQAELRQVIVQLTAQLGASAAPRDDDDAAPTRGTPARMPGHQPTQAVPREDRPRRKRAHGYGRHRMAATETVVHALRACPGCRAPLAGGTIKRTREVIELPVPRIVVTTHVYLERQCPDCGKRCVPRPELAEVVSGQSRLGHGLVSLIAVLLATTLHHFRTALGALPVDIARLVPRSGRIIVSHRSPVLARGHTQHSAAVLQMHLNDPALATSSSP